MDMFALRNGRSCSTILRIPNAPRCPDVNGNRRAFVSLNTRSHATATRHRDSGTASTRGLDQFEETSIGITEIAASNSSNLNSLVELCNKLPFLCQAQPVRPHRQHREGKPPRVGQVYNHRRIAQSVTTVTLGPSCLVLIILTLCLALLRSLNELMNLHSSPPTEFSTLDCAALASTPIRSSHAIVRKTKPSSLFADGPSPSSTQVTMEGTLMRLIRPCQMLEKHSLGRRVGPRCILMSCTTSRRRQLDLPNRSSLLSRELRLPCCRTASPY